MILRAAILGCGGFAHKHAHILTTFFQEEVELVAFCDRNEWKARAFGDQYSAGRAAVFNDHRTLLDQAKLNLLVVCLPPYGHSDEVELAAAHGVHLLMEKPIALSSEHAWRMVAAAEQAGIQTQVGFMNRFGEAVEQFHSLLASGAAGPAGLMSARYFCNSLHAPWWRVREKSGGQLVEQVIHMVDLMRYLLGEPATVYSRQANLFHRDVPNYTVEDVSATVISFAGGALGVIYATNGAILDRWISDYRVVAQNVTADFADANQATFYWTDEPGRRPTTITSTKDIYLSQMQDLLAAIRNGGATRTPLREGAKTLDLALAAARSAEVRAEISIEQ
ncbi:MAG: Gfo/Idh/MocA family oxidoreductase [Chloroflexi bacterium]|nr:Gfo/Idh/MocA family oxidoreductase [Chloroflexota bacterium]MCI0574945.1 Gfo/Idh/MocA family oxidoreductase [Chloroflexota bacterium]MCI0645855.1 Gfo/Idh/MocA family oxidoreductase [Chloroflexota bacterium]MCI0725710.1 Gfo/Idh/MocA family oxidoreductase [Chloroflexota bacterium]